MKGQKRHKARCYTLQALYQWQIADQDTTVIEQQFSDNIKNDAVDNDYFYRLFSGVVAQQQMIDRQLEPILDRELSQLTAIELNILRLATYELIACVEVPYRVIINEALEIAKTFGTTDEGFKYINGVLDNVARQLRQSEIDW